MDEFVKYITLAATIIANRRAAGFPVIKETLALITYIANPVTLTREEWAAHDQAQEDSRALRRNAKPRDP